MEDMEPELAIFCKQVRLLEEDLGHQLSHKAFDLQFLLPSRCVGLDKGGTNLWEWPTSGPT